MAKEMYISSSPHETKVAVLEDDQLVEVYFERDTDVGLVGGIYKGRVNRVLPGMQSAFVDIGLERDAFLYVSDFFYEDQEEYDKVFEEAEARATKFTKEQIATVAAPELAAPVAMELPAPAAAEFVAPVAPSPVALPVMEPAAPAPAPSSAASAPPVPRDSRDRRGFDPRRGRRRRHRGRPEFGEGRPPDRRFPPAALVPARAEEPPAETHAFEILPGESLAKYSHPGSAPSEPTVTELPEGLLPEAPEERPLEAVEAAFHERLDESGSLPGPSAGGEMQGTPSVVPPAEPSAPSVTSSDLPRDEDTIIDAVPFTPGAMYSAKAPAAAGNTAAKIVEAPLSENVAPSTVSPTVVPEHVPEIPPTAVAFTAEAAASYAPEGIAGPPSGEPEPKVAGTTETPMQSAGAASESPSERAENSVLEDDAELEGESSEQAELLAEASEGELDDEGELPAEGIAGNEREGQSTSPGAASGEASASGGTGAPGDRSYTLREPHQRPRFAPRRRRGRRGPGDKSGGGGPDRGGPDRGPRRPEGRRDSQPRSGGNHHPVQIAEVLKEGQEILVQIAKEPLGTKGARITSHVALPGRYLVYMPTIDHIGVSRKIASEEERLRLRNIILENKGPLTGGFIVRTAGQGRSEEEFKADLKFLSTLWSEIRSKHDRMKAPALIHRDLDLVQRLLRDLLTPDFKCVRVDSEIDYERVLDFVNRCQPALVGKVKLYSRDTPLYEEFGIQAELDKALKPKVWLKSGGYIVINQTEALVAVDVNTGKYVGKTNRLEDTIVKTNVDAVNEIVRQVRLRDLGGIIVIDFIDMDERKNRARVVQALEEALRYDRAPTKVISFHDFGLVAVTRKRVKQSLERTLCVPCNYCTGSGWVKSVNTVCNEILAEARKMAKGIDGTVMTLRVNPEVAKALKSREGGLVAELESLTKKDVIIKSDATVHQERFEIY